MIQRVDGVTYGDIDAVLRRLGFVVKETSGRTYFHQRNEAVISLSSRPLSESVAAYDLVGVRGSLDWQGIIDRDDFDLLLLQVGAGRNEVALAK